MKTTDLLSSNLTSFENLTDLLNSNINLIISTFKQQENIEIDITNNLSKSIGINASMQEAYEELENLLYLKSITENKRIHSINTDKQIKQKQIDELYFAIAAKLNTTKFNNHVLHTGTR